MKSTTTVPVAQARIDIDSLKAGDILLYLANNELGRNIADATKGYFSHAAIYVGCSAEADGQILHTGPNPAQLVRCNEDFSRTLNGVFVIRVSTSIDENKLYELAKEQEGRPYDFGALPFIGLSAWDRRTLDNCSGVFKFMPRKLGENIVKTTNKKGSKAVCSGLSIDILSKAANERIFPKTVVSLDQLSPNCIYDEALKHNETVDIYELIPISRNESTRKKKHIFLAGLALKKSM